jgi:molybdopterin adenylyltransferase
MKFNPEEVPGGGRIDLERAFVPLRIAVLTVSDTRTAADDTSGDLLAERAARDSHNVVARAIVKDEVGAIQTQVKAWIADPEVHIIVSTGGTGLSDRDVTPEALRPLFEKEIDGFSTMFHMVSLQTVGLATIKSRALAGLAKNTVIFALPGSNGAVKDGWDKVIRWQLDSRHRPCNLAELTPPLLKR